MQGIKPFENRGWATDYRGPIVIHAGKSKQTLHGVNFLRELGYVVEEMGQLNVGLAIGVVKLIECMPLDELPARHREHWSAEGPLCWPLVDPKPFHLPFVWSGGIGLFDVSTPAVLAALGVRDVRDIYHEAH
jgi:hypothetical protein